MDRLRELLEQLQLHFQVEMAMADVLDDHGDRIKALEEYKLKNDTAVSVVKRQYSELLLIVKEINKKISVK